MKAEKKYKSRGQFDKKREENSLNLQYPNKLNTNEKYNKNELTWNKYQQNKVIIKLKTTKNIACLTTKNQNQTL